MTELLERAFAEAGKLTPAEQDLLAARVLAELGEEDEFDRAIAASAGKLATLAGEALAEHRAGQAQRVESCGAGGLNGVAGGERSAQEEGPRYGQ